MQDISNRRNCGRREGVYENSLFPAPFFCKSKTALRNKIYSVKQNKKKKITLKKSFNPPQPLFPHL